MKTRSLLLAPAVGAVLVLGACSSSGEVGKDASKTTSSAATGDVTGDVTGDASGKADTSTQGTGSQGSNGGSNGGSDDAKSTDTTIPGAVVIRTDTDSQLGEIVVTGEGLTLYAYTKDGTDSSSCNDACAASWIPLTGESIDVEGNLSESDFKLISRNDGTRQVSFKGHPLYRFGSDKKPAQTNGHGVNAVWYVMGADGKPITKG